MDKCAKTRDVTSNPSKIMLNPDNFVILLCVASPLCSYKRKKKRSFVRDRRAFRTSLNLRLSSFTLLKL